MTRLLHPAAEIRGQSISQAVNRLRIKERMQWLRIQFAAWR